MPRQRPRTEQDPRDTRIEEQEREIARLREELTRVEGDRDRWKRDRDQWKRDRDRWKRRSEHLKQQLDAARRAGFRQAAPFAKDRPQGRGGRPGRRAGARYGRQACRPRPAQVDETHAAPAPAACPDCGGAVEVTRVASQYQEELPKVRPAVRVHDFPTDAQGKAIPYGVYDMARNEAWVSVGRDHDTPAFAVASIRHWWRRMGRRAYPNATALYITADAGGSNGYRSRAWKHELQQLADQTHLTIHVSHFPPGTSKWNKIEHRLFCHITANWRGTPLTTYETIVDRIGNTRTAAGLPVRAALDTSQYPTGATVTKAQMEAVALVPDTFHGEWNYKLAPR